MIQKGMEVKDMEDAVRMCGISKRFGGVAANAGVDFSVRRGEVHALLGENGSGKSTLMNILSGIYAPDAGQVEIDGVPVSLRSPRDALQKGIGMVHQHFLLAEVLSVLDNVTAGSDLPFVLRKRELAQRVTDVAARYGLPVDVSRKVYDLSVGERQTVELLKMLCRGATVLILDEPTAVLTPQEAAVLFDILRGMREQGCAIILITHKLNEVLSVSDRVTVLRKGRTVGTVETAQTSPQQLTELMVGRPMSLAIERVQATRSDAPVLAVNSLTAAGERGLRTLDSMSFEVYGGEILGVAGIAGSGQRELCEIIAGMQQAQGGDILFLGEQILGLSPIEIMRRGISMSFVPEDRLGMGLVGGMDITANVMLRHYQQGRGWSLDLRSGREKAEDIVQRYDVSTPSVRHILGKLSGGNIQKVLLGREVDLSPRLLVTAYPVRGLDIGASYNVYDILNEQKRQGVAVLFIGEDLDVLLALSDRLMVLHAGRVMGLVDPKTVTKEEVGLLMMGSPATGEGSHV